MATQSLFTFKAGLLIAVTLAGVAYLTALRPASPDQSSPEPSAMRPRGGDSPGVAGRMADDMAPSERTLSDSELARVNEVSGQLTSNQVQPVEAPRVPLVMLEPGRDLGWNDEQMATFQELRAAFAEEMGSDTHASSSPEYLAHWMEAQSSVDELLRQHLGEDAFIQLDGAAARIATRK